MKQTATLEIPRYLDDRNTSEMNFLFLTHYFAEGGGEGDWILECVTLHSSPVLPLAGYAILKNYFVF